MSFARIAPLRITAPIRQTVGGTAVQGNGGTSVPCHGVLVKAVSPGQTIYVGVSGAVTTGNGWPLADGNVLDLQVKNVTDLWFIASAAGQAVALLPYSLY